MPHRGDDGQLDRSRVEGATGAGLGAAGASEGGHDPEPGPKRSPGPAARAADPAVRGRVGGRPGGSARLGVAAALVDGRVVPGDLVLAGGRIARVGVVPAGRGGLAVPGLIDLQVNGFAGVDLLAADPEQIRRALIAIASSGVTACRPTLISAPQERTETALRVLAEVTEPGGAGARPGGPSTGREGVALPRLLGAHLEGPFLSPRWRGAHRHAHLLAPDRGLCERLLAAGSVGAMTLAPELEGGLDLVAWLTARAVTVQIGHSDADAATCHAAFERGARALTHVLNAHRRFAARDPGPAGAALARDDVTVTAIVDGIHLAPETARAILRAAGERLCLITDAVAPAGLGDGRFRLGDREIQVSGGVCRLAGGTLAGSVTTMDASVRALRALGAELAEAVHAASRAPALLAGRPDLGRLSAGAVADLAVLDDTLEVERTLVAGREAFARG